MSWDISIMRLSKEYQSVSDIPSDEQPLSIGSIENVHRAVSRVFPGTDWADPAWGVWDAPFGSIEFNLGTEDPAMSMMLHVRAGPQVVPLIVTLCHVNQWHGIDCSYGDFIEKSVSPEQGLECWATYRGRVLGTDN